MSFLKLALSENGQPSSKRIGFFAITIVFLFVVVYNMFTGKQPAAPIMDDLFWGFTIALGSIFGSGVMDKWSAVKTVESDNNSKIGKASPTPPPAPIITPGATIINK